MNSTSDSVEPSEPKSNDENKEPSKNEKCLSQNRDSQTNSSSQSSGASQFKDLTNYVLNDLSSQECFGNEKDKLNWVPSQSSDSQNSQSNPFLFPFPRSSSSSQKSTQNSTDLFIDPSKLDSKSSDTSTKSNKFEVANSPVETNYCVDKNREFISGKSDKMVSKLIAIHNESSEPIYSSDDLLVSTIKRITESNLEYDNKVLDKTQTSADDLVVKNKESQHLTGKFGRGKKQIYEEYTLLDLDNQKNDNNLNESSHKNDQKSKILNEAKSDLIRSPIYLEKSEEQFKNDSIDLIKKRKKKLSTEQTDQNTKVIKISKDDIKKNAEIQSKICTESTFTGLRRSMKSIKKNTSIESSKSINENNLASLNESIESPLKASTSQQYGPIAKSSVSNSKKSKSIRKSNLTTQKIIKKIPVQKRLNITESRSSKSVGQTEQKNEQNKKPENIKKQNQSKGDSKTSSNKKPTSSTASSKIESKPREKKPSISSERSSESNLTDEDNFVDQKKAERREKNRIAAKLSRTRKKEREEQLEINLNSYRSTYLRLKKELTDILKQKHLIIKAELGDPNNKLPKNLYLF